MSAVDPTVRTSRVFEATIAVFDRIAELTLPDHSETGDSVPVFLFRDPGWELGEYVVVQTNDDPAVNEWAQAGPAAADELIVVDVTIRTMIPETDAVDPNEAARRVILRLEALADPVQLVAYDLTTGKPKAFGFTNERLTGRRRDVQFALHHTENGVIGAAVIRFALAAQI